MIEVELMTKETFLTSKIILDNQDGLNLFLSKKIAQCARQFQAEIKFISYGEMADARNPLEIMSLAVLHEETLIMSVKGEDAQDAVDSITNIFK